MPWRKYTPMPGKYGQRYRVARGIQVRRDPRGLWTLFFEKRGFRKNKTFGQDQKALAAAIREAEILAKNAGSSIPLPFRTRPPLPRSSSLASNGFRTVAPAGAILLFSATAR